MKVTILEKYRYKAGYEVRKELVDMENGDDPVQVRSAYMLNGDYIGSPKIARYLIAKRGIKPEKARPHHNICSIGFCQQNQKWYGWSHRAICGFGIGDMLFEEDYGDDHTPFVQHGRVKIETLEQARQAAVNFAEYVS